MKIKTNNLRRDAMSKILDVFTKEYKEETEYRDCMKKNVDKFKLGVAQQTAWGDKQKSFSQYTK